MANTELMDTEDELKFYREVHTILDEAKSKTFEAANNIMTYAYWNVGKRIIEQEQKGNRKAKYGSYLIKRLSQELSNEYGTGFSVANIRNCRQLYLTFKKGAPLGHQLTWTNLKYILPIKNESKKNYYINLCIKQNLTKNQLIEKIKNNEYERLEYKENIELISGNQELTIKDMIKNPILIKTNKKYDKLSEKALKQFILDKIEEFLLELGVGFTYVGSEVKLGKFYCDLLFFNYELNCFVVIEIKIRKLKPQDMGQIKHYMNYIDMNMRKDYMNETIGVIMCKEGDNIVIKYATDDRILMTTYNLAN